MAVAVALFLASVGLYEVGGNVARLLGPMVVR
jgi:hypothetical protein